MYNNPALIDVNVNLSFVPSLLKPSYEKSSILALLQDRMLRTSHLNFFPPSLNYSDVDFPF